LTRTSSCWKVATGRLLHGTLSSLSVSLKIFLRYCREYPVSYGTASSGFQRSKELTRDQKYRFGFLNSFFTSNRVPKEKNLLIPDLAEIMKFMSGPVRGKTNPWLILGVCVWSCTIATGDKSRLGAHCFTKKALLWSSFRPKLLWIKLSFKFVRPFFFEEVNYLPISPVNPWLFCDTSASLI
jgi:hypothetical protein